MFKKFKRYMNYVIFLIKYSYAISISQELLGCVTNHFKTLSDLIFHLKCVDCGRYEINQKHILKKCMVCLEYLRRLGMIHKYCNIVFFIAT